ncbi:MAG: hypothetical protein GVY27_00120 [Deinococcus-Thermus bacterium]|nr:hypothetical protein [Deinococcota bacterium]
MPLAGALATLASTAPAQGVDNQWINTVAPCDAWTEGWTVQCHRLRVDAIPPDAQDPALQATYVYDGYDRCTQRPYGGGPARSFGDAQGQVIERILLDASRWGDGHGFRSPTLPHGPGGASCEATVFFGDRLTTPAVGGGGLEVHGVATLGDYDSGEARGSGGVQTYGRLYVARVNVALWAEAGMLSGDPPGLDAETRDAAADLLAADPAGLGAVVHELFHAVQQSYDAFPPTGGPEAWITEGTAEAFALDWLDASMGRSVASPPAGRFGYPLDSDAYDRGLATEVFWRWLARERAPNGIGGLHDYFDGLSSDPDAGLADLNEYLLTGGGGSGSIDPDGLYGVFPDFVAATTQAERFIADPRLDLSMALGDDRQTVPEGGDALVQPIAANAHRLTLQVPPGETAGLEVELVATDGPAADLHLVVDEALATDPGRPNVADRNLWRGAVGGGEEPTEVLIRVANIAEYPGETERRAYRLEVALEPLDPCSIGAMTRALGRGSAAGGDRRYPEDEFTRPKEGRLAFDGVVSDAGVGCTHFLGATTAIGRAAAAGGEDARFDALGERGEAMMDRIQGAMESGELDLEALADAEAGDVAPGGDLAGSLAALQDANRAFTGEGGDAVIQLYSPNALVWQTGMVEVMPAVIEHAGVGGWAENAVANLVIRLPGTAPEDLREGESYNAEVTPNFSPGDAVYGRWRGALRPIPGAQEAVRPLLPRLRAEAAAALDIGYGFQGRIRTLDAVSLTGTVTVEDITGTGVRGTFDLSGSGRLTVETMEFDYEDLGDGQPQLVGSTTVEETEQRGPLSATGRFEAEARYDGIPRLGFMSVNLNR